MRWMNRFVGPSQRPAADVALTRVLRFPRPSLATETDTEREKYFPGEALLGLLLRESWEPDTLRSKASPGAAGGTDEGLRVVCILKKAVQKKKHLRRQLEHGMREGKKKTLSPTGLSPWVTDNKTTDYLLQLYPKPCKTFTQQLLRKSDHSYISL